MTWADENYTYRRAISIDNTASGSGTISISFDIPTDLAVFWDNVQSDGDDIYITGPDGFTPIDSNNATAIVIDDGAGGAFNGATKAGRIRIDKWTAGVASEHNFVWVYFGYAAATSNSAFGTWSSPATVTARISRQGEQRITPRVRTRAEKPGATAPAERIPKISTETLHLYWDLDRELNLRDVPYEGRLWYESIKSATITASSGGSPAAAVVTATNMLMVGARGQILRTVHPAGSSGTDYTLKLKVTTDTGRVIERRALLLVRDPDDQ